MAKARFLKDGNKVTKYEEGNEFIDKEKDEDYLKIGDMEVSRSKLLSNARDSGMTTDFFNSYSGFGGPKQRRKIVETRNAFLNAVLSGKVDLEGINTFVHNMPELATDGKTKRRFLSSTFNTKDENTLNALGAAAALDILKKSGYSPKKKTYEVGDTNKDGKIDAHDKNKYDTSFDNYLYNNLGYKNADELASVTSKYSGQQRFDFVNGLVNGYLNSLQKAKDSGEYNPDTDFDSVINQVKGYTPYLVNEDTYKQNMASIDSSGRMGYVLSALLGMLGEQKGEEEKEKTPHELRMEELNRKEQAIKEEREYETRVDKLEDEEKGLAFKKMFDEYVNGNNNAFTGGYTIPFVRPSDIGWDDDIYTINQAPQVLQNSGYWGGVADDMIRAYGNQISANPEILNTKVDVNSLPMSVRQWTMPGYQKKNVLMNHVGNNITSRISKDLGNLTLGQLFGLILGQARNSMNGSDLRNTVVFNNYTTPGKVYDFSKYGGMWQSDNAFHYGSMKDLLNTGYISSDDLLNILSQQYIKGNNANTAYRSLLGGAQPQVPTNKNGGILRMQNGGYYAIINGNTRRNNSQPTANTYAAVPSEGLQRTFNRWAEQDASLARRLQGSPESAGEVQTTFDKSDYARLGAAAANLSSAIAAFTGFSPASTAAGLAGTVANTFADFTDEDVSRGDAWKNLAINAGLDLVSLVPFAGAGTGVLKVVRTLRSILPVLSYVAMVNNAPEVVELAQKAISDRSRMTTQDWIDLANSVSMLASGAAGARNAARIGRRQKQAFKRDLAKGERVYAIKARTEDGRSVYVRANKDEYNAVAKAGKDGLQQEQAKFKELFGDKYTMDESGLSELNKKNEGWRGINWTTRFGFKGPRIFTTDDPNDYAIRNSLFGRPVVGTSTDAGKFTPELVRRISRFGVHSRTVENPRAEMQPTNSSSPANSTQTKNLSKPEKYKFDERAKISKKGDTYYSYEITKGGNRELKPITDDKTIKFLQEEELKGNIKFDKNGGIIKAGRFANGGVIYKYQDGGNTIRNTFTNGSPLDYAGFSNVWGQVTGKDLLDALQNSDMSGRDFINTALSLQTSYRNAVNSSGNGYDQNDIRKTNETGLHQTNYNKNWARGNAAIENAIKQGIITRRGTTGDNSQGGYNDSLHGLMNSLRTWGYAESDEARKAFESSDIFKQISDAAAKKGLVYGVIDSLSGDSKYYYGFTEKAPDASLEEPIAPVARNADGTIQPPQPSQPPKLNNLKSTGAVLGGDDGLPAGTDNKSGFRVPNMLDPIVSTIVNNRATKDMIAAVKPVLTSPYRTYSPVENDYLAERTARDNAARTGFTARRIASETSDATLGALAQLQGTATGNEEIRKGDLVSGKRFYDTRNTAIEHENQNAYRNTIIANNNRAAMNRANMLRTQLGVQNRINNWSGVWQPWYREGRALAYQDAATRMQQSMAADNYARNKELSGIDITTPEGQEKYNEIMERYTRRNANKSLTDYVSNPFFARNGGKIKSTYEMNMKSLDNWSKNYFKSELKAKDDNTKRLIYSSAGWMNYMKMISDNVNKVNNVLKYAPKKK